MSGQKEEWKSAETTWQGSKTKSDQTQHKSPSVRKTPGKDIVATVLGLFEALLGGKDKRSSAQIRGMMK